MTVRSICICTPSYTGSNKGQYTDSLLETVNVLAPMGIEVTRAAFYGCALISHARNALVQTFLEEANKDVLLFIDDDMSWRYTDVLAVIGGLESAPVVGVAYAQRRSDAKWFTFVPKTGAVPEQVNTILGTRTFLETEWMGTGFLAVSKATIQNIHAASDEYVVGGKAFREVFLGPKVSNGQLLGEDVLFGFKASYRGFKQTVCLDSHIVHHGSEVEYDARGVRPWLREWFKVDGL